MMKPIYGVVALMMLGGIVMKTALASERFLAFEGGIGVDPVAGIVQVNGAPVPVANVVRGTNPGGRPWVINDLAAEIEMDGQIEVRGEGLLLSGGEGIGTVGNVQRVAATLFCGPSSAPQALHSDAAPIDANGDFEITGMLDAPPPHPCSNPVLLIRNATVQGALGAWFAAGILKR